MCHKIPLRAPLALLLAIGAMPILSADEDDEDVATLDRTPEDCVSINRIRETDVVDKTTIVFEMRGGEYYTNILERDCPGLDQHKRFGYEVTSGQLCDIDIITVLEQWGGSLRRGFTCQLGAFHPITKIEAEDLLAGPDAVAARENDIEIEEVETPPADDESAAGAEPEGGEEP